MEVKGFLHISLMNFVPVLCTCTTVPHIQSQILTDLRVNRNALRLQDMGSGAN